MENKKPEIKSGSDTNIFSKNSLKFATTFTNIKQNYNLQDNELVASNQVDLQELVNSNLETALEFIYEKFLNGEVPQGTQFQVNQSAEEEIITDNTYEKDTLAQLAEVMKLKDKYIDKYNLEPNTPPNKVFAFVDNLMESEYNFQKEQLKKQKEEVKSEKEIVKKKEQEAVQELSE